MTTPRRTAAITLTTLALAGMGLLGLTGCAGTGAASTGAAVAVTEDLAALGVEEQALTALGFAPAETVAAAAEAEPSASAPAGNRRGDRRRPLSRELLRSKVLHAEAVVQTKDGTKTIVSQHGTITAINATTVTVKSADGFTMTWTFGEDLRVLERRRTVQPTDLATGAEIGVAGAKSGDGGTARLIVRRVAK